MDNNNNKQTLKTPKDKPPFMDASVKEAFAAQEVQAAIKKQLHIPSTVFLKKIRAPYTDKETKIKTQKIEAVSGTSIADVVALKFTLINQEVDAVNAINKEYRIVDYSLALDAIMSGKNFQGYSATGFKLLVTKIEEVEEHK